MTYDKITWTCLIDDGQVVQICSPDGTDYKNAFVPHIRGLIEDAAMKELIAKQNADAFDAAVYRHESQLDEEQE